MEEEETTPTPEIPPTEPTITLTVSQDAALALAASTIHYRALFAHMAEMAPTILHLDEVYSLILQHPQVSSTSRAFLQAMRYQVAGLKDEPEGKSQHATARHTQG